MRSRLLLVVALMLVVGVLAGCGASEPAAEPTTAPAAESGAADLTVKGMVDNELSFSIDDIKALGTEQITSENSKGESETNEAVRLSKILDKAGVKSGATTLVMIADDGYSAEVALADMEANPDCHLKFRSQGGVSSVMLGLAGNTWVKGVVTLEIK